MAQERIAEATPSASSRSSGSPFCSVRVRRAYTDFERWVRWAAGPKTLRPKTWFAGAVRSGDPSCPPFGLHCAAARLRWAVVDKLKTPWTWLCRLDRRTRTAACPCTDVEDFARATRPGGEGGLYRMSDRRRLRHFGPPGRRRRSPQIAAGAGAGGGELRRVSHFSPDVWEQNDSPQQRVAELARRHYGIVDHLELAACGLSSSTVNRWTREGRFHRLYRGVYAVGHAAISGHGRWLAAV